MANLNITTKVSGIRPENSYIQKPDVQSRPQTSNDLQKIQQKSEYISDKTSTVKENQKSGNQPLEERQQVASEKSVAQVLKDMSEQKLDDAIVQLNDSLQNIQRNLEFSVDKEAGKIVISVTDKETDEVVRQIPSEEVLQLAKNLHTANERLSRQMDATSGALNEGVLFKQKV